MPIAIDIKQQGTGMEKLQDIVKMLNKFGSRAYAANLVDTPRLDSAKTNVQIIEWLAESGLDFTSLEKDEGKILQFVTDIMIKGVDNAMKGGKISAGRATNIMSGALKKGLKQHITKNVLKRIKQKRLAKGGNPRALNKDYLKYRQSKYGVAQDKYLEATGQLMDAFARGVISVKIGK
jgi:hypothetical protein